MTPDPNMVIRRITIEERESGFRAEEVSVDADGYQHHKMRDGWPLVNFIQRLQVEVMDTLRTNAVPR
jgi:hypothetical protein